MGGRAADWVVGGAVHCSSSLTDQRQRSGSEGGGRKADLD